MKLPRNPGLEKEAVTASFSLPIGDRAELRALLRPEHISHPQLRRLYEIGREEDVAPRIAYDKLWTEQGHLDNILSQDAWMKMVSEPPKTPYPAKDVVAALRKLRARRDAIEMAQQVISSRGDMNLDSLAESFSSIAVCEEGLDYNDRPAEVFDTILHTAAVGMSEAESSGFGIPSLDRCLRGLRRNDFVVVGAPPNTGKTPFVLDLLRRRSRMGFGHQLVVSLEMAKEDIVRELVAMDAGIPLDIMLNGAGDRMRDEVLKRVTDSAEWVDANFSVIDPSAGEITLSSFEAIVRRKRAELRKQGQKLDCIMLDYLQLLVDEGEFSVGELGKWTKRLKLMAIEQATPIFLISNLNNGYDRRLEQIKSESYVKGSRADFRGSGGICYDASKVLFLLQHFDGGEPVKGKLWLQVLKNKYGLKDKLVALSISNCLSFSDGH